MTLADEAPGAGRLTPQQLEQAFSLFNQASAELTGSWRALQQQVARLTDELAAANGELRRQLAEKQAVTHLLTLLLDSLPAGVVLTGRDGAVVAANPAATQWFADPLVGRDWEEVAAAGLGEPDAVGEYGLRGRRVTVSRRRLDEAGGHILLIHDVTEARAMQVEVERHRRLSSMGEMVAALAHQLRTPLATALLYTSHLARDDLAPADRARFAARTLARLRHLEGMIADMLLFARGESAANDRVGVEALAQELAQVMEPQMAERGIAFTVAADAPGAVVTGNHKALAGAMINLLENAMQATPAGGRVALTARVEGREAWLAVADTGRGIDPDAQARLFDHFFTTRAEGTGLGLAIVRQVAQAHHGAVDFESAPARGSTFTLKLPLSQQQPSRENAT